MVLPAKKIVLVLHFPSCTKVAALQASSRTKGRERWVVQELDGTACVKYMLVVVFRVLFVDLLGFV